MGKLGLKKFMKLLAARITVNALLPDDRAQDPVDPSGVAVSIKERWKAAA
jgi:hypothetical protein